MKTPYGNGLKGQGAISPGQRPVDRCVGLRPEGAAS